MLNIREYFDNYFENNSLDAWNEEINNFLDLYKKVMDDDESDGAEIDEWANARGIDLSLVDEKNNETFFTEWLWDYADED